MGPRLHVMFVIPALGFGGAERQLVALARGLHARGHRVVVTTFYGGGPLAEDLRADGIPLVSLEKRSRWDLGRLVVRLAAAVRRERPAILHGYTSEPNILAVLLKPLLSGTIIVCGVRNSTMDLARFSSVTQATYRLEATLGRFADLTIVNSEAGRRHAEAAGFSGGHVVVIPNGIDTDHFQPDAQARQRVRVEWGLRDGQVLVGVVGRHDPMKDHATFVRAAGIAAAADPSLRFVWVGDASAPERDRLAALGARSGLGHRLKMLGPRRDMTAVYCALDVLVSSSVSESFPNSVAEAMACGTPCVVTDVGDSAHIVGETGEVVASGDAGALAAAIERLARRRADRGPPARQRIVDTFTLDQLIDRTEATLMASSGHGNRSRAGTPGATRRDGCVTEV